MDTHGYYEGYTVFKMYLHTGKSPELNGSLLDSYLAKKTNGHKIQDKQAKRIIESVTFVAIYFFKMGW